MKTNLRKVGGSVMLSVPPAVLELLHLSAGVTVALAIEEGRLIIEPAQHPRRYTLNELLAQCKKSTKPSKADQAWLDSKPVGKELL